MLMGSVYFRKGDWGSLMKRAAEYLEYEVIKPLVFALYSERGSHWNIIDAIEIPTVESKGRDERGFYIYVYPNIKSKGFYPPRNSIKRFCGTFVVGDKLELSLTDAYWMARDRMDFRIKVDKDSEGKLSYKVWVVDHKVGSFSEGIIIPV